MQVFTNIDAALNIVLPGSNTHKRYQGVGEVGLALVVASDFGRLSYSPFDPTVLERLAFKGDNQETHPAAWEPKDTDERDLGGAIPEGMGRYIAFALAKINTLTSSSKQSSHSPDKVSIAPGKVGIAGAQWISRAFLGASGLWEVHDHIVTDVFADEIADTTLLHNLPRTAEDIAADLESMFARIRLLHPNTEAANLNRSEVARLLVRVDEVVP